MIVECFTAQDAIPVTGGRTYGVQGIAQCTSRIIFLIASDDGRPHWCPVEWFQIVDGRFPGDWELSLVDPDGAALQVLIGYPEASLPGSTQSDNRSAISLDAPDDGLIDLEWESAKRSAKWVWETKGAVVMEQCSAACAGSPYCARSRNLV